MDLQKAVSGLCFVGALVIGTAVGFVANFGTVTPISVAPLPAGESVPVRAETLAGEWTGTWGYGGENCTIEIDRTEADRFYGTLRKEGAEIAIAGTLDPKLRRVFFHETKTLKLGPEMSEWSLGTNSGS